ncbi:MAG: type 1 glutamine amidotransferase [Candidatus Hydrogenedentes bacterium]|nr:type 1 glutamine amidotransferase [Candidatus Hydrogenedentota bacterium]
MHLHFLQHAPFEGPANILTWAESRGFEVRGMRLYANETVTPARALDWLVVLGGPMSVGDEERCPWLVAEKKYIRSAIAAGKTIIGICLGAQLIAEALGGQVRPNAHREIGWFPVTRTAASDASPAFSALPRTFPAFHWHGDTFTLPPGVVRLASSEGCALQAFSVGNRIFGLQFHLESTRESIEDLIAHCGGEMGEGPYMQPAEAIRGAYDMHLPTIMGMMTAFLDAILERR